MSGEVLLILFWLVFSVLGQLNMGDSTPTLPRTASLIDHMTRMMNAQVHALRQELLHHRDARSDHGGSSIMMRMMMNPIGVEGMEIMGIEDIGGMGDTIGIIVGRTEDSIDMIIGLKLKK